MLCIEIDEGQRKTHLKNNAWLRYDDICMDFSCIYIYSLKNNPDPFKDADGKRILHVIQK